MWAGGAALLVMGVGRLMGLALFPPELVALRLFELLPITIVERLVIGLGASVTWVVFAGTTLVSLVGAGLAGLILSRVTPLARPPLRALYLGGILTLLGIFLFLPVVGLDVWGESLPHRLVVPAPIGLVVGALTYGFVFEGPRVSVWVVRRGGG